MTTIDTAELAGALAADVDAAFEDLVRLLQHDVFGGALRMTGDYQAAQDITQEAFVRAYEAMRSYPPHRIRDLQLRGWIWTIAANLCRNRARGRSRKPETALTDSHHRGSTDPGPEQLAIESDGADRLAALVAALPWPQRSAVVLHHVVGLTYDEIALALERPAGTVKSDAHRGIARLRKEISS